MSDQAFSGDASEQIQRTAMPPPPSPEMLARMVTAAPKYGVVFA
jgi:hypothetical protein